MLTHLSHADAIALETAELEAWLDMYRAMPGDFRNQYSTELIEVDKTFLTRSRSIPFVHFNAVLNLGLASPASEAAVDAAIAAAPSVLSTGGFATLVASPWL
jgi:hypothetical protein